MSSTTPPPRHSSVAKVALALILGLLLGALGIVLVRPQAVVGYAEDRVAGATPTATITISVTPSPPPGTTRLSVDVPDACLDALRSSGATAGTIRDLVAAVQGLQVGRARDLAGRFDANELGKLGGLTTDCASLIAAATGSSPTPTTSG